MSRPSSTFPHELGISTHVGLTRGVGVPGLGHSSFAESEMRYREQRYLADADRRRQRRRRASRPNRQGLLSRWTMWLPRLGVHRSSAVSLSSSGCGN
jgi:hypothetical protein